MGVDPTSCISTRGTGDTPLDEGEVGIMLILGCEGAMDLDRCRTSRKYRR